MRVLLTGGAGYIGSHTALCLLQAGHDVVVLDNLDNSSPESLRRVQELTGKQAPLIVGDCTDEKTVTRVFEQYPIDAVIHFAGLKAVGESVAKPLKYYQNNLDATMMLCKVMESGATGRVCVAFTNESTAATTSAEAVVRGRLMISFSCLQPDNSSVANAQRIIAFFIR